jgi:hypothetical protein
VKLANVCRSQNLSSDQQLYITVTFQLQQPHCGMLSLCGCHVKINSVAQCAHFGRLVLKFSFRAVHCVNNMYLMYVLFAFFSFTIILEGNNINGRWVGIATGYWLDNREGGVPVPIRSRIFCSPRRPLGPTQPIQWVPGVLSPLVNRPGEWSWPLTSNKYRGKGNVDQYIDSSIRLHVVLN